EKRGILKMIAEIISVGTEILLGDIVDTNSQYIASNLSDYGYDIHYITSVGDNKKRLYQVIDKAIKRSDLIIITGGIGPTDDDITREVISKVCVKPLELRKDLLEKLEKFFAKREYDMPKSNKKQAFLPKGARALSNQLGTADGFLLDYKGKKIIVLPGVPKEMKNIFDKKLIPEILSQNSDIIRSKVLNFFNIGESSLEEKIKDILDQQTNPTIALYAGEGEVKIRITAKAKSEEKIKELLSEKAETIRVRVNKYIYAENEESIASATTKLLAKKNIKVAVAESCTGGLVGNRITDFPGSSNYFAGGFIVYSNQAKINQLGVKKETLEQYGAVSRETAREMAENTRKLMEADIAISITGIAGPGGGSKEKPVGLVYMALADNNKTNIYKLNLNGNRKHNKWMSSQYALYYIYKYLTVSLENS
ncbi:MAG: competence/damage-inducible protein A, partial [Halanaerobiales bacterium]